MKKAKNKVMEIRKRKKLSEGYILPILGEKRRGWKLSEGTKRKMGLSKLNKKNPQWKGDSVGLNSLHLYLKSHHKKPERCVNCGKKTDKLDLANISGEYKRDINDFEWICRSCHMLKDGRINNLKQYN